MGSGASSPYQLRNANSDELAAFAEQDHQHEDVVSLIRDENIDTDLAILLLEDAQNFKYMVPDRRARVRATAAAKKLKRLIQEVESQSESHAQGSATVAQVNDQIRDHVSNCTSILDSLLTNAQPKPSSTVSKNAVSAAARPGPAGEVRRARLHNSQSSLTLPRIKEIPSTSTGSSAAVEGSKGLNASASLASMPILGMEKRPGAPGEIRQTSLRQPLSPAGTSPVNNSRRKPDPKGFDKRVTQEDLLVQSLATTQDTLGRLISKPVLHDTYLRKPSFEFLHDLVQAVIRTTGFANGLFTAEEADSANFNDKQTRLDFLNKSISVVSFALGEQMGVSAKDMLAGVEAEKTNTWLQNLYQAATTCVGAKSDEAVQLVLNGERVGGHKKQKRRKQREQTRKDAERIGVEREDVERKATEKKEPKLFCFSCAQREKTSDNRVEADGQADGRACEKCGKKPLFLWMIKEKPQEAARQEMGLQANASAKIKDAATKATRISVRIERASLDESFGFQLGSIQTGLTLINKIHDGGLADKQTELKMNDMLISVNGVSTLSLTRTEVVGMIKSTLVLNLVVARGENLPEVYKEVAASKTQEPVVGQEERHSEYKVAEKKGFRLFDKRRISIVDLE